MEQPRVTCTVFWHLGNKKNASVQSGLYQRITIFLKILLDLVIHFDWIVLLYYSQRDHSK